MKLSVGRLLLEKIYSSLDDKEKIWTYISEHLNITLKPHSLVGPTYWSHFNGPSIATIKEIRRKKFCDLSDFEVKNSYETLSSLRHRFRMFGSDEDEKREVAIVYFSVEKQ